MPSHLPLTGERTVPGIAREQYWFARHEVAYRWLAPRCSGRRVVEAGSGEGYGAQILRTAGAEVIAVDYDRSAIEHSARTYPLPHVQANLAALPFGRVDAVVSLQVIEHLWDLRGFLAQARRIADWTCLSTPNRLTFSPGLARGAKPTNPFHVEEFDAEQLDGLLRTAGFTRVEMLGVHHAARLNARPALIAEQVAAAITGHWPAELEQFVAGVSAEDFVVSGNDPDSSLDLLVVAS
ncbi:MAG TPA: class I SAM-dependent methyltransferase [Actinomycetota bacterium]|nr:class I SAM-dependent methyltransferase [Actinomycetota bacterium]